MAFGARILADSLSPDGVRLTTFEVTFPRIVLAEFNTHRVFSRNSASSRAIPVEKMIQRVLTDPYIPTSWGKNQKGMQADEEVFGEQAEVARLGWLEARDSVVHWAKVLGEVGIHKQLTNRLLEPFMWHTCIVSATEWDNFFHLRNNRMAHPDIQTPARMMQELYTVNVPRELRYGQWHLPLVTEEDLKLCPTCMQPGEIWDDGWAWCGARDCNPNTAELVGAEDARFAWLKVSIGRCARVSYLTHDGKRDPQADIELHDKLMKDGHMSPFEHVARPTHDTEAEWHGNFRGWVQVRKLIPNEADILGAR